LEGVSKLEANRETGFLVWSDLQATLEKRREPRNQETAKDEIRAS
jgi:hypothetical protein